MKRGLHVDYLHFHSEPYTNQSSTDKVRELYEILKRFNPKANLHLSPFGELQKKIVLTVPDKFRIIFYRRFMFRLATLLARKLNAKTLVTGESLGQVASQTIENMLAVHCVTKLLILQPLICFDKKEIVDKAKQIGTYETSILPHEDCCTVFMPKSPETRAKLIEVMKVEEKLDVDELITEAFDKIE